MCPHVQQLFLRKLTFPNRPTAAIMCAQWLRIQKLNNGLIKTTTQRKTSEFDASTDFKTLPTCSIRWLVRLVLPTRGGRQHLKCPLCDLIGQLGIQEFPSPTSHSVRTRPTPPRVTTYCLRYFSEGVGCYRASQDVANGW